MTPLAPSFYERPVLDLARACVGAVLFCRAPDGITAGRIVETEAYRGPEDLAAHSRGGRRTRRTEAMFGPPGSIYMFLLYGMHWAFNIVAGPPDTPHAVLVRAIEPVEVDPDSIGRMLRRRFGDGSVRTPARLRAIGNGPGKLCQAMALDGSHYGASLAGPAVWLAAGERGRLGRSPRINVEYAGVWAARPWRFYERGNRCVSVPPRG